MERIDDRATLSPAMRVMIPLGALIVFGGLASFFIFGSGPAWYHGTWVFDRLADGPPQANYYRTVMLEKTHFTMDPNADDAEPGIRHKIIEVRVIDEIVRMAGRPEDAPGADAGKAMVLCFRQDGDRLILVEQTGDGSWVSLAVYRRP